MCTSEWKKDIWVKSHDCHVLMQQLLPLAIRGILHKNVCAVIVELCSFFKQLCFKVLKIDQLEHLENDIIVTLCKLERNIFSIILWCYGTFTYSSCKWGKGRWTSAISMDVSYQAVCSHSIKLMYIRFRIVHETNLSCCGMIGIYVH